MLAKPKIITSVPRQLDIESDTALASSMPATTRPRQNGGDLSTVASAKNRGDLSTVARSENRGDLSTVIRRIETRRKALGVSIAKLCAMASVHPNTYVVLQRGKSTVRQTTVTRLTDALERFSNGERPEKPRSLLQATLRQLTATVAQQVGADVETVLATTFEAERPQDPAWLLGSRMRRCAIYLVVEGIGIQKASVGHALGISRQAVFKAVAVTELERDKSTEFDQLMRSMMIMVAGYK